MSCRVRKQILSIYKCEMLYESTIYTLHACHNFCEQCERDAPENNVIKGSGKGEVGFGHGYDRAY